MGGFPGEDSRHEFNVYTQAYAGGFVTDHVSAWIGNDSTYHAVAREHAQSGDLTALERYCLTVIRDARQYEAAWQVQQQHAPAELARVDWSKVASDLLTE